MTENQYEIVTAERGFRKTKLPSVCFIEWEDRKYYQCAVNPADKHEALFPNNRNGWRSKDYRGNKMRWLSSQLKQITKSQEPKKKIRLIRKHPATDSIVLVHAYSDNIRLFLKPAAQSEVEFGIFHLSFYLHVSATSKSVLPHMFWLRWRKCSAWHLTV